MPNNEDRGQRVIKAEIGPDGSVIASEDVRPGDLVVVERVRRSFADVVNESARVYTYDFAGFCREVLDVQPTPDQIDIANRRYEEPWYGSNPLRMVIDPVLYHLFEPRPPQSYTMPSTVVAPQSGVPCPWFSRHIWYNGCAECYDHRPLVATIISHRVLPPSFTLTSIDPGQSTQRPFTINSWRWDFERTSNWWGN